MNKNAKLSMMARKRRKDGTFMEYMGMNPYDLYGNEYGQPWTPKMERSGSFSVGRDGTRTPVYPMSKEMPWSIEGTVYWDNEPEDRAWPYYPPHVPPVYTGGAEMHHKTKIGFADPDKDTMDRSYQPKHTQYIKYHKEMEDADMDIKPLSQFEAMQWVNNMKNADGSTGPHYTMEQAKQIMDQQGYSEDEVDFFVAINMMYSDYCKVAKRNNCGTTEFYAAMAKAFLDDKDAQPEKLSRYKKYIAGH